MYHIKISTKVILISLTLYQSNSKTKASEFNAKKILNTKTNFFLYNYSKKKKVGLVTNDIASFFALHFLTFTRTISTIQNLNLELIR
jgi:hypothetical protein